MCAEPLSSPREHQPPGVEEVGSQPAPQASCLLVWLCLGYLRLFLIGQPPAGRPAMARPTVVDAETKTLSSALRRPRGGALLGSGRVVGLQSRGQPFFQRRALEAGKSGDRLWLFSTSPVSRRLLSQRLLVGAPKPRRSLRLLPWVF